MPMHEIAAYLALAASLATLALVAYHHRTTTLTIGALVAEAAHTCAQQQAIAAALDAAEARGTVYQRQGEALLTTLQRLQNRTERTDGRAERLEFAVGDFFDWLAARDRHEGGGSGAPPLPVYYRTQTEVPDLEARRAAHDTRHVALSGGR